MLYARTAPKILFTIFLAVMLLLSCSSQTDPSAQGTKIRIVEVTHSMFYAPQYVAITKGFFEQEGLQVTLSDGFGGDKTMTALLADEADIILMGAEGAVYVTARDAASPVIAFAQVTQTDGSFLISREPVTNFEWEDLRGKTLLGQRKGGMPEMVSEYVQRRHGLKPHEDVKIIQNVDYQHLGNAFAAGTGDFAQLFEPDASILEKEGKGTVVASFGQDSGRLPYTVYITKKKYLDENPETITRFTRALYKAQRWVEKHSPAEIAEAIAPQFPEVDREILIRVLERFKEQDSWATDPIIDQQEYEHMLDVMREANELPKEVPYEKVIHTELVRKVLDAES